MPSLPYNLLNQIVRPTSEKENIADVTTKQAKAGPNKSPFIEFQVQQLMKSIESLVSPIRTSDERPRLKNQRLYNSFIVKSIKISNRQARYNCGTKRGVGGGTCKVTTKMVGFEALYGD